MKKILLSLAIITIAALGVQAQRMANYGNRNDGMCRYADQLNTEQRAELAKMATAHQAAMSELREKMITSTEVSQRVNTRNKMNALRANHIAEISDQVTNWGIEPMPAGRYAQRGMGYRNSNRNCIGRGNGMGYGNGVGNGNGMGQGRRSRNR
jgi:hypothetical protein